MAILLYVTASWVPCRMDAGGLADVFSTNFGVVTVAVTASTARPNHKQEIWCLKIKMSRPPPSLLFFFAFGGVKDIKPPAHRDYIPGPWCTF